MSVSPSSVTLDVLEANVALLAEKERLESERQRLMDLDRLRREFVARLSHDLRTPLSSILGFSDLLLSDPSRRIPRRQKEMIEAIRRNGSALLDQINDLLDLSTLESGQLVLKLESVPLDALFSDLRAATAPVIGSAGIEAVWPDAGSLDGMSAVIDRRRVLQAMINLVDNARKFTPKSGRVMVWAERRPGELRLRVCDTGRGMGEDERRRIEAGLPPAGTAPGRGHGLGLAIVRAVTERHGGRMLIEAGPARGCAVTLFLPQPDQEVQP